MTAPPIDAALVARLVRAQFPRWGDLAVTAVEPQGWDNRTFRLGDVLSARLPSAPGYVPQVEKEHRWLPRLAEHVPLPIPRSLALGGPGEGYEWPWSVRAWLDGSAIHRATLTSGVVDQVTLAGDLAGFLRALWAAPVDGPPPGQHSAFRGGPVSYWAEHVRRGLAWLRGRGDERTARRVERVWGAALDAEQEPVDTGWFHGDVAKGNLLATGGRLCAVIDFGCAGVGDRACDLTVAWTLFDGAGRDRFREAVGADAATWARARGWAVWKALLVAPGGGAHDGGPAEVRRVLDAVLDEA